MKHYFRHLPQAATSPSGFTLIEVLLVTAIIGILAMVVITAVNPQRRINEANDAQIRADLATMRNSLEAYAAANKGVYPSVSGGTWWCENCVAGWADPGKGSNLWIPELVSKGYIKRLPTSPRNLNGACGTGSAYIYISFGDGYKIIAHCTPTTGFNDGDTAPSLPYCSGSPATLNTNPDGNPQHALKPMVDPIRSTYSYAVYTSNYACY